MGVQVWIQIDRKGGVERDRTPLHPEVEVAENRIVRREEMQGTFNEAGI